MQTPAKSPAPSQLLKALAHPLRRRILRAMSTSAPASPVGIARTLDAPLGDVAYHFRILDEHDVLNLVDTRQVRGAREHFYRSTVKSAWAKAALEDCRREDEHDASPADR